MRRSRDSKGSPGGVGRGWGGGAGDGAFDGLEGEETCAFLVAFEAGDLEFEGLRGGAEEAGVKGVGAFEHGVEGRGFEGAPAIEQEGFGGEDLTRVSSVGVAGFHSAWKPRTSSRQRSKLSARRVMCLTE
jgi:hypothetical protein